jgi:hypothetical protein
VALDDGEHAPGASWGRVLAAGPAARLATAAPTDQNAPVARNASRQDPLDIGLDLASCHAIDDGPAARAQTRPHKTDMIKCWLA